MNFNKPLTVAQTLKLNPILHSLATNISDKKTSVPDKSSPMLKCK